MLFKKNITYKNKILRLLWRTIWICLFRPSPRLCHRWRIFLLRLFGAKIGSHSFVYPSVQVWAPWNLEIGNNSCLSHFVDCYCVDKVYLGHNVTVSQYSFLCTASHDYNEVNLPLIAAPIRIEDHAWITADVFIGPGVTIGEGAVVLARSTVIASVQPWLVMGGSPIKKINTRNSFLSNKN